MNRFALSFVLVTAFNLPAAAQVSVVMGLGGELSGVPGSTVSAPLFADMSGAGGELLGSYTVRISWDPAVLYFQRVEPGVFATPYMNSDSAFVEGILWLSGISATGAGGVVDLASIIFGVDTALTTAVTVQVTEISAAGTLTDLLPNTTPVNGSFCPALGYWGDVDRDRLANSRDALVVLSSVVDIPLDTSFVDIALGDVDADGLVNTRDALIILSYSVGLDILGQRVLLVAGGACTAQESPTISVAPDIVDLVLDQEVQLRVQALSATGDMITISGVNWWSADPLTAFVTPDGTVYGVAVGSTTITASVAPGIEITIPANISLGRNTWYVDAVQAVTAPVQLGTLAYPFATPEAAFRFLREGDTVRIAPGIHDYEARWEPLNVGAVIFGDTLPDGTRPILRSPDPFTYLNAFEWNGGVTGSVENLVLQGFENGVLSFGLQNLTMRNVRIEEPSQLWGGGVIFNNYADTVRIVGSEFIGDPASGNYWAVSLYNGAAVIDVQGSSFQHWGSGAIDVAGNHTLFQVTGSNFFDTYTAIDAGVLGSLSGPLVVSGNLIDSVAFGVLLEGDSMVVTDNVITAVTDYGIWTNSNTDGRVLLGTYIARNSVTCDGSVLYHYGIIAYVAPSIVEDNGVRDCYEGIYAVAANSATIPLQNLTIIRDTVFMAIDGTGWAAIDVTDNRWGNVVVSGNRIQRGSYGMYLTPGSSVSIVVDSNAVSATTSAGIYISPGGSPSVSGIRNNIANNTFYGIENWGPGVTSFTLGRFVSNTWYGIYNGNFNTIDATQNWWGDALGPIGTPGDGLAPDAIFGSVDTTLPLASDPIDVPPLVPHMAADPTQPADATSVNIEQRAPEDLDSRVPSILRSTARRFVPVMPVPRRRAPSRKIN